MKIEQKSCTNQTDFKEKETSKENKLNVKNTRCNNLYEKTKQIELKNKIKLNLKAKLNLNFIN